MIILFLIQQMLGMLIQVFLYHRVLQNLHKFEPDDGGGQCTSFNATFGILGMDKDGQGHKNGLNFV